jgi:dihydrofolate reductase
MRRIVLQEMISLDGFLAGPHGALDWPLADEEFEQRAAEHLDGADTLLFGRKTFEMMAGYWPNAIASPRGTLESDGRSFAVPTAPTSAHAAVARRMNAIDKIVFSSQLGKAEWGPSRIVRSVDPAEIAAWKQATGKEMILLGSVDLASEFIRLGLIDEYRFFVNPIVLGAGTSVTGSLGSPRPLHLQSTHAFRSGVIELRYVPRPGDGSEPA